jgi:hypothetical protein
MVIIYIKIATMMYPMAYKKSVVFEIFNDTMFSNSFGSIFIRPKYMQIIGNGSNKLPETKAVLYTSRVNLRS